MIRPGSAAAHALLDVAWILLIVFMALGAMAAMTLVGIRVRRRVLARRRTQERASWRTDLVALVVGEEPDASEAAMRLIGIRGRRWDRVDDLLVGMVPKVRGDARERVLAVLRERGSADRAVNQTRSRRSFARCRGAFALGVLDIPGATRHLLPLLADRSHLVRRVTVRAFGLLRDPRAANALLDAANRDLALHRDLVQALAQLDGDASAALRNRLVLATTQRDDSDRSGPLAATALDLRDDVAAAQELAAAVDSGVEPLQLAAARALGQLDAPAGIPALQRALEAPSSQVQLAAATALGKLGARSAVPALLRAVEQGDPTVSRTAAASLLALGREGHAVLRASSAPYATESVAIDVLRRPA